MPGYPTAVYSVFIDWDLSGDYEDLAIKDISKYVQSITWNRGRDSQLGHAKAGTCDIVLKDPNYYFSPENTSSPFDGFIKPHRPIKVEAFYDGNTYQEFNGFVNKWVPHPHWDLKNCYVYCLDSMDELARGILSTPVILQTCQHHKVDDDFIDTAFDDHWVAQTFTPQRDHIIVGVRIKMADNIGA